MTLTGASRTEEKRIFTASDESAGSKIKHQTAVHLRIESEVEVVERLVSVTKAGLLFAAGQQSARGACEFVRDQTRDQINGGHGFGLRLPQAGFQHSSHSA